MTPKQKRVLDFITSYHDAHGYSPSYEEIRNGLGVKSKSGVHRMIHSLVEQGKLKRNGRGARSVVPHLRIVESSVPLVINKLERTLEQFDDGEITADGVVLRIRPLAPMLRDGA